MKYLIVGVVSMLSIVGAAVPYAHAASASDGSSSAQTAGQSAEAGHNYVERAKVVQVLTQSMRDVPGTNTTHSYQTLTAVIEEGPDKQTTVTVTNDYINLTKGEEFYVTHNTNPSDGVDQYYVSDVDRLPALWFWIGLFVVVAFLVGGKQGIRGLLSLVASIAAVFYLLIPGILHGYSPILLSIGICSLIVLVGSYVTHGFNRTTHAAVIGMILTIALTGALALAAVHTTHLSGFNTEEVAELNFQTLGTIDFVGLLLGGIMIGLLGILYDAAIGQAVAVEELSTAAEHYSRPRVFRRAMRIGREHIGALINTLAIAYVGAYLPLLLLLHFSNLTFAASINSEIFATEIVRTIIGSIGLILAVPVTTVIATFMLVKKK